MLSPGPDTVLQNLNYNGTSVVEGILCDVWVRTCTNDDSFAEVPPTIRLHEERDLADVHMTEMVLETQHKRANLLLLSRQRRDESQPDIHELYDSNAGPSSV